MKAAQFHEYGPASNIKIEEVATPTPTAGHVLVEVHAAGLNPIDWKYRKGLMQQWQPLEFPFIGGYDLAGVITEVGPDVEHFTVGQEVFGRGSGAFAEYALVPATSLALKPTELSYTEAASIPIGAATAWAAVVDGTNVQPGERVLIHGAAGGVGQWATQFAHWKGAHVVGTTSTKNIDFAKSRGCDVVIDYTTTEFEDTVRDLDAVIDTVGGELGARSIAVIKPGGIFATIAGMPPTEEAEAKGVRVAAFQSKVTSDLLNQIVGLIQEGVVRPEVGDTFPLDQIVAAQELSELGHGRGRIVLTVR